MERLHLLALACVGCGRVAFDPVELAWIELGASATAGVSAVPPGTALGGPRIAVTPDDRPVVSWSDAVSGNEELHLRAWDGTAWVGLGGSEAGGGISGSPERSLIGGLAVSGAGEVCQAWVEDDTDTLRLRCWDGTAWRGRAGSELSLATPGNPWWPSIAFIGGALTVAWEDYGGGDGGVYARRFDGVGAWTWLGPMALPGLGGAGQLVRLAGTRLDDLWVAYANPDDGEVHVAHWDGVRWTELGAAVGGVSRTPAPSAPAYIAIGDRPYVAWLEGEPEAAALHVRTWDGAAWSELGGSATGDGIAAGQRPVESIEIAVDPRGRPVVAYVAAGDVFVRAWDGAAWAAVGAHGAGGISDTGGARRARIAIGPAGTIYVAWIEDDGAGQQVFLRALPAR